MFVKKVRAAVLWPVSWKLATSGATVVDGDVEILGTTEEASIRLKFRRCGNAEFNERWSADTSGFDRAQTVAHNRKLFDDFVEGWADYVDEAGAAVPFTAAEIDALLDEPNFPAALGVAYTRFHLAQPEERAKNSLPSPAGGPATADSTMSETASASS